jgi:hypothetical protein
MDKQEQKQTLVLKQIVHEFRKFLPRNIANLIATIWSLSVPHSGSIKDFFNSANVKTLWDQ